MRMALAILAVLVVSTLEPLPSWSQQAGDVFNGTVEAMDSGQGTLTVKNELGRQVVLELSNPDLLRGLSQGDQVTIELEKPGVARKVTRLSVPELKTPAPSSK
jgi:hypothetical protein